MGQSHETKQASDFRDLVRDLPTLGVLADLQLPDHICAQLHPLAVNNRGGGFLAIEANFKLSVLAKLPCDDIVAAYDNARREGLLDAPHVKIARELTQEMRDELVAAKNLVLWLDTKHVGNTRKRYFHRANAKWVRRPRKPIEALRDLELVATYRGDDLRMETMYPIRLTDLARLVLEVLESKI